MHVYGDNAHADAHADGHEFALHHLAQKRYADCSYDTLRNMHERYPVKSFTKMQLVYLSFVIFILYLTIVITN